MSPRQKRLYSYIKMVLEKYPNAKYTLIGGLWYIRNGEKLLSYGQINPYDAWLNAAARIKQ